MTNSTISPAGQMAVDCENNKMVPSDTCGEDDAPPPELLKRRKYVQSCLDPVLVSPRVLDQLLAAETFYGLAVMSNYLYTRPHQTDGITAAMRTAAADWMAVVVEDQGCAAQVLLLAVQYLDRLLATSSTWPAASASIRPSQLQLAAAAALFVASKLCELRPLTVQIVVLYMDEDEDSDDVTPADVLAMETLLLNRLNWDLAAPTSLDFVRLLEQRYDELARLVSPVTRLLMRTAREYQFCAVRPSVLAAAVFLTAIQVAWQNNEETVVLMQSARWKHLHASLANLLSIDKVPTVKILFANPIIVFLL